MIDLSPMSPEELRDLQDRMGWLNRNVEALLGVSDQTVINWRQGHTAIPTSAGAVLRAFAAMQEHHPISRDSESPRH